MPLCYGGGVKTVAQIQKIISRGVEKVAISSAAIHDPHLLSEAATRIGRQSIVVVMDVKTAGSDGRYELYTQNGTKATGLGPAEFAKEIESLGVGEIVINNIDRDGVMKGYDLDLVQKVRDAVSVPLTVLGGAGSLKDIAALIQSFGIIGAAAGSLFVFKGVYRAVLINYPSRAEKDSLVTQALQLG